MDLSEFVIKIQDGLRTGKYVNEAAVSVQVLLPLLRRLGWPDDDPEIVKPEYSVCGQRVDYALIHRLKPIIFIEVKKPGRTEGGDSQLFEYAYKQGIRMAILTDGREWFFFLPCEAGAILDRCFYKLDILERTTSECIERFNRYLQYKRVCEEKAFADAKVDYQDKTKNRDMKETLPRAWQKILEKPDDILVDLLSETVEDLCGYKPEPDITSQFIREKIISLPTKSLNTAYSTIKEQRKTRRIQTTNTRDGKYGFDLYGVSYDTEHTARSVMIKLFEILIEKDSDFLQRFKSVKHGRKRRYVSDTKGGLYPGNPELAQDPAHYHRLSTGDYIGTNYSKRSITEIIKLAAEVAGIRFGKELVIYLGDEEHNSCKFV